MTEIIALLSCLAPHLSARTLHQMHHVIAALLCSSGRVTTLGLSRWAEGGGSHRTLQRWYHTPLDWGVMLWCVVRRHLLDPEGVYLLAGDDVVVSKAGTLTHGVGRFYSSLAQRPIPGLSFVVVSLIDVRQRRSYPLQVAQHLPMPRPSTPEPAPVKRGRGRPKGRKSHVPSAPLLSPELSRLQSVLQSVLVRIAPLRVKHVVLDGFFGTAPATFMVQSCGLHIISKLRHNAALYLPYNGPKPTRGPTPRYGDKLDIQHLPANALCTSVTEHEVRTDTYQLALLHHDFPQPLNVVVIVKTHLRTRKHAHVLLFSTDGDLTAAQIVDYYGLRFQIEFNFRDAKQYWGLEDFMNRSPVAVTNAANLALFMVNVSAVLLQPDRHSQPDFSVLDLKAHCRARRYLTETIKSLPDSPAPDLISRLWQRLTALGGIRSRRDPPLAA
jgi:putative transposase